MPLLPALSYGFQSTPSVGRTTSRAHRHQALKAFQSTSSVGRTTCTYPIFFPSRYNFNPRPPWGGRQRKISRLERQDTISIHALRGEGDQDLLQYIMLRAISIHALRGEGDEPKTRPNSHTKKFQSTPSVGRATFCQSRANRNNLISIHALRGEGDPDDCPKIRRP